MENLRNNIWQGKAKALGKNCANVSMLLHTKSFTDYIGFERGPQP
jgi:hypothetical protein